MDLKQNHESQSSQHALCYSFKLEIQDKVLAGINATLLGPCQQSQTEAWQVF